MSCQVLPALYLPPVAWFAAWHAQPDTIIDPHQWFEKQQLFNRCWIMTANGPLRLTVPVTHTGVRHTVAETRIAYGDRWQQVHWRALESAYRRSPYFEFYEDELAPMFETEFETLWQFQEAWIRLLLKCARLSLNVQVSEKYLSLESGCADLRSAFPPTPHPFPDAFQPIIYTQTFGHFYPNLSMLDLVLNCGPRSGEILSGSWTELA